MRKWCAQEHLFRQGTNAVRRQVWSPWMVFVFSRMNIWPPEAVSRREDASLRSCLRDSSLFWSCFHHVIYLFFYWKFKKNETRIKTDYDGFGDLLLELYWLTDVFYFVPFFCLFFFYCIVLSDQLVTFLHSIFFCRCIANFMSHLYDIIFRQYVGFFFFNVIYLLLKLFVLFCFHANQSVCMFTLIFCVGTWLFQPV